MSEPVKPREWTLLSARPAYVWPVVIDGPELEQGRETRVVEAEPVEEELRIARFDLSEAEQHHVDRIAPVIEALSDQERRGHALREALEAVERELTGGKPLTHHRAEGILRGVRAALTGRLE